jgi:hypothetical protein
MRIKLLMATVAVGAAMAGQALAWGDVGHRMIGEEAMRALPDYMPEFLRTPQAVLDVGEFSREPDRWRNSGKVHDDMRDPGHFIDLLDDGTAMSGASLDALPATLDDFSASLRAKGTTLFKSGWLPYSIADSYEQVVKDMAQWRILNYLEGKETDKAKRAWYHADRVRREEVMTRDIGVLSHYVGDATNPMHVSVHYNGWGADMPNPNGFTNDHVHSPLEGDFVNKNVAQADVRAGVSAYMPCTDRLDLCIAARLKKTWALIVPEYQLQKDGGFADGDSRGKAFQTAALAKGASDLRDTLVDAWRDSKTMGVGYPAQGTAYDDFVAGRVADPWLSLHGY